jgi:hypothetical protein
LVLLLAAGYFINGPALFGMRVSPSLKGVHMGIFRSALVLPLIPVDGVRTGSENLPRGGTPHPNFLRVGNLKLFPGHKIHKAFRLRGKGFVNFDVDSPGARSWPVVECPKRVKSTSIKRPGKSFRFLYSFLRICWTGPNRPTSAEK